MRLYNSYSERPTKETTLVHFGSLLAAASRIESKFSSAPYRGYDGQDNFFKLDSLGRPTESESISDALAAFAKYALSHKISIFDIESKKALLLNDLWGDDPIASGGIDCIDRNQLSNDEISQLKSVFEPFTGIMEPIEVLQSLTPKQLAQSKKFCESNALARKQINMRKRRARGMGEDWRLISGYESVWVHRTIELRRWAVSNGFDGFTYKNFTESNGDESFVCLHDKQAKLVTHLVFNEKSYLQKVKPIFKDYLQACSDPDSNTRRNEMGQQVDIFWSGLDPKCFWQAI